MPIGTRHLGENLVSNGVDVSFWATGDKQDEQVLSNEGLSPHLYPAEWPVGWRRSPKLVSALAEFADRMNIFHIHEVWNYPQLMAARIAHSKGIPYILAPRASLEPWKMRYKGFKKKVYLSLVGDRMLRNAVCLHAVASAEVEGFRKVGYRGPAFVINNGIVPEKFEQLPEPSIADAMWPIISDRRVVLFLSRLSPEKGLEQLIPAWASVIKNRKFSDAVLVIAGPDDRGYRSVVEERIKSFDVGENTLLTGMIGGNIKLALMNRADIYVLPSYSEGFSNSLLENMAVGTRVIITPGCNFPEAIEAGAGVCVAPDQKMIAEALQGFLEMSCEQRRIIGFKGHNLVMEKYTWDVAARKLITVYNAILEGKEIPLYPQPCN